MTMGQKWMTTCSHLSVSEKEIKQKEKLGNKTPVPCNSPLVTSNAQLDYFSFSQNLAII